MDEAITDVDEVEQAIAKSAEAQELLSSLELLLSDEQIGAIETFLADESIQEDFVESLLSHEAENYSEAIVGYKEILHTAERSTEEEELLLEFIQLAENGTLLTEYVQENRSGIERNPDGPAGEDLEEQVDEDTTGQEDELIEEASDASNDEPDEEPMEEANDDSDEEPTEGPLEDAKNQEALIQEDEDVDEEEADEEAPAVEVVSEEEVNYRGYLSEASGIIYTEPGSEEFQNIGELEGTEVKVLKEAETSEGTWFYIEVVGSNLSGWVTPQNVDVEEVSSAEQVNYRGYLARPNDTINSQPWGTPGYEEIRRVEDLRGREVIVTQEASTQRADWLFVSVRGTNIAGWIDKAGVDVESISNQKDVDYRGYLSRANDTINTQPWGTPGYEEIRHVEDLRGREVEVLQEASTQRAEWLYVNVRGTDVAGWIDKAGVDIESISSEQTISYRGVLSRANDTINTKPWGTPGYEEIRRVRDLVGNEVEVLREAMTQRAAWAYVNVRGTDFEGWIDRAGIKAEAITSQKNVNYRGYLARKNDTINTLPWGVRGYKEIRRVNDLQGREVKVLKEAVTPRATWLYVDVVGTNVSGWIDKAGVTPEKISSQKNVNYTARLSRSSDTINTQPWGTIGNRVIRRVGNLANRQVNVTREAKTQRATWAYITVPGTNITGWIDKDGLRDNYVIYLDPGHGGNPRTGGNPGAVYNGVREQDLNLNISLQVRDALEKLGYEVVMSRENDNNSYHNHWRDDLFARPAHANEIGADLLVSVHHNASGTWDSSMNGIETYIYGTNPDYPPLPENRNSHNNPTRLRESRQAANAIHKELIKNTGARDRGVQEGAFIVVREAKMPAVLLELGFMSNRNELNKLRTTSYQQKLINGIVTGIHNYFLI